MKININVAPAKPAVTIRQLCFLLNKKIDHPNLFKVNSPTEITFDSNGNATCHTLLIGILIVFAAKHFEKYGFFIGLGCLYFREGAGVIRELDQKSVALLYDFVERLDLNDVNIEIN